MVFEYSLRILLPDEKLLNLKVLRNTEGVGVTVLQTTDSTVEHYSETILLENGKVYHVEKDTVIKMHGEEIEEEIVIEEISEKEVMEWLEDAEVNKIDELFDYEYGKKLYDYIFELTVLPHIDYQ